MPVRRVEIKFLLANLTLGLRLTKRPGFYWVCEGRNRTVCIADGESKQYQASRVFEAGRTEKCLTAGLLSECISI